MNTTDAIQNIIFVARIKNISPLLSKVTPKFINHQNAQAIIPAHIAIGIPAIAMRITLINERFRGDECFIREL